MMRPRHYKYATSLSRLLQDFIIEETIEWHPHLRGVSYLQITATLETHSKCVHQLSSAVNLGRQHTWTGWAHKMNYFTYIQLLWHWKDYWVIKKQNKLILCYGTLKKIYYISYIMCFTCVSFSFKYKNF